MKCASYCQLPLSTFSVTQVQQRTQSLQVCLSDPCFLAAFRGFAVNSQLILVRRYIIDDFGLGKEFQPASMLSDLTHPADPARRALVRGVVLGAVERALLVWRPAIDRCEARRADVELSELIKLNLNGVVRIPLTLRLSPLGLISHCQSTIDHVNNQINYLRFR